MSYKQLILMSLVYVTTSTTFASTPWVMERGTSSLYLSYITESFDEKYLGEQEATPIAEIDQQTTWIHYYYGLTDKSTITLQLGYTESDMDGNSYKYSGMADTKLSLIYELQNQFMDEEAWTLSLLGGFTIGGNYERGAPGRPHAPGDDANGLETAILVGRQFNNRWSTNASFGYRYRADSVPNEIFYSSAFHFAWREQLSTSIVFDAVNAWDGDDIGGPSFAGEFHKTEEDRATLDLLLSYKVSGITLVGGVARVIDVSTIAETRNTGKSDIIHFSLGYNF